MAISLPRKAEKVPNQRVLKEERRKCNFSSVYYIVIGLVVIDQLFGAYKGYHKALGDNEEIGKELDF